MNNRQILTKLSEISEKMKNKDINSKQYKELDKQHRALFHYLMLGVYTGSRTIDHEQ